MLEVERLQFGRTGVELDGDVVVGEPLGSVAVARPKPGFLTVLDPWIKIELRGGKLGEQHRITLGVLLPDNLDESLELSQTYVLDWPSDDDNFTWICHYITQHDMILEGPYRFVVMVDGVKAGEETTIVSYTEE